MATKNRLCPKCGGVLEPYTYMGEHFFWCKSCPRGWHENWLEEEK